jgi:monoamine oxidase
MELSDEERDVLTGLWTSTCSTSCEEAGFATMLRWSALCQWSYSLLLEATSRYKFKDGTRSLIDAMISDGKPEVRISAPVERVDQDGEQVVITTYEGERISSSAAVITVPLNVLADVEFSPPLSPGKQSAASERQASRGVKVWALLRGDQEDFYGVTPGPAPLTWVQTDIRLDSGLLLVGFGPDANLLDMNDPIAVQSAVREFLPEAEVLAVRGHDWVADPYSQGLWPIFRPFQLTRYLKELQRPEGRLFFAGSETANGWNGFIDGAIESGLRVGHELLQRLGR